jgi:hypothetical protein
VGIHRSVSTQQKATSTERAGKGFLSKRQLFLGSIHFPTAENRRAKDAQERSERGVGYRWPSDFTWLWSQLIMGGSVIRRGLCSFPS